MPVKLSDIADIVRGKRITKRDLISNGTYPVISGGSEPLGRYNSKNRDANTITIASYGTAGFVNFIKEDFWANDVCLCVYSKDKTLISEKYLYYVLKFQQKYIQENTTHAIPDHIPTEFIKDLTVPAIPMEKQKEIVEILDNFESICTSLNTGLPAEIEARQKQYEYYRDRLLTFDRAD